MQKPFAFGFVTLMCLLKQRQSHKLAISVDLFPSVRKRITFTKYFQNEMRKCASKLWQPTNVDVDM